MTTDGQEKKQWLSRYCHLDQHIQQKADEITTWRTRAEKITPNYWGEPRGGGEDHIQSAVEIILQLEGEIDQEINALVALKREIQGAIQTVEDPTLQQLLEYRYLHGLTWEQVAERMDYSDRWVRKLHGEALCRLQCPVPCSSAPNGCIL